jgi:RHS repeat-associated protein
MGFVKRTPYDGLGRLIRVEKPLAGSVPPEPVCQSEDYYYDGVRRIQEVVTQPDVQGQDPPQVWTEREFIYGPDYVDEFVAQIDDPAETGAPPYGAPQVMFILQDANFNVVGILSAPDNPQTAPDILAQYTYEPYGALAISEEPGLNDAQGNANTLGHQGLFAYPLTTGASTLHPNTLILYYNRNRWYNPQHGRFLQRDQNGTGAVLIATGTMNGGAPQVRADEFDSTIHSADGLDLYCYAGSNPVMGRDPSGLFLDLLGATGLGLQMDANTADVGMSLLKSIRGMTDLVNTRNTMLSSAMGLVSSPADMRTLDIAIAGYDAFQQAQAALLAGGALKAGAKFALGGFTAILRRARGHHGVAKYLGGFDLQFLYTGAKYKKYHHKFEQELLRRLKAAGFPDSNIGKAEYAKWLATSGRQGEAMKIIRQTASDFDAKHGTDFFFAFELNFDLGNFFNY